MLSILIKVVVVAAGLQGVMSLNTYGYGGTTCNGALIGKFEPIVSNKCVPIHDTNSIQQTGSSSQQLCYYTDSACRNFKFSQYGNGCRNTVPIYSVKQEADCYNLG